MTSGSTINGKPAGSLDFDSALSTKRKRDSVTPNSGRTSALPPNHDHKTRESIRNIWQVLKSRESSPFVLESRSSTLSKSSSQEPSAKRQKLSENLSPQTIDSKISDSGYQSLEQFANDVETAIADVLSSKSKPPQINGNVQKYSDSSSIETDRSIANIKAFRKYFRNLVESERLRNEASPLTNGVIKDEDSDHMSSTNNDGDTTVKPEDAEGADGRTVLTIFGIAQGHKQLFSSFQQPVPGAEEASDSAVKQSDVLIPLRERSLPTGVKTTKIHPIKAEQAASLNKRTFGEVFAPPTRLPQISPPKPPKSTAIKGNSITWGQSEGHNRQAGYTNEKLPVGHWLGYGGVSMAQEPTSPEARRKQRDRALSSGESAMTPSLGIIAAQAQAKEEALFRTVYSSFAPCRDNSSALIPEEVKNQIWWQRIGRESFDNMCVIDPALEEAVVDDNDPNPANIDSEEESFRKAVEEYDENFDSSKAVADIKDKDTVEILTDISNMLETLHSYQKIRNSSLGSGSPTTLSQNAPLPSMSGSPSTPSLAEVETFNTLKSQLSLMVSMLPPFAVAKLNGQQLEELNITRNILTETPNVQGVMEEDQATRVARAAALAAAVAGPANAARSGVSGTPQNTLHPTASRSGQMNQSRPGQLPHYGSQSAPRPQSQFQRQSLSSWQSPVQQRPTYPQQQTFNQNYNQTTRPNQTPGMRQPAQYYPRPNMNQVNGINPSPSPGMYNQQAPPPPNHQRTPSFSQQYGTQASPQKPIPHQAPYTNFQPQPQGNQSRPTTAGSYQPNTPNMNAASPPQSLPHAPPPLTKMLSHPSAASPLPHQTTNTNNPHAGHTPSAPHASLQQAAQQSLSRSQTPSGATGGATTTGTTATAAVAADIRPSSSGSAMSGVSPAPVANMGTPSADDPAAGSEAEAGGVGVENGEGAS